MNVYTDFALFYDRLQSDIDYRAIARYYDTLIKKFGGKRTLTLDLACGTGQITRIFSDFGYDMIAVDGSDRALSIAANNSAGLNIQYLCQNMTELDMYGTLDNVVCVLDGINHLDGIGEIRKVFGKISLFMNSSGLFLFDLNTLYKHSVVLGDNAFVYDNEDLFTVWQNFYGGDGKVDIELDFFVKEEEKYIRYSDAFSEYAYDSELILRELSAAGFEVLGCYDWLTVNPPSQESEKIVYVAKKI